MRKALEELLDVVESAIRSGDWKVDGACDPDSAIASAKKALAQPEQNVDDGYCKACDGWKCTAKAGCVALENPPPQCKE